MGTATKNFHSVSEKNLKNPVPLHILLGNMNACDSTDSNGKLSIDLAVLYAFGTCILKKS